MAENKKSFIAYVDWKSTFDLLTDEEAGKLIKHIFSFVSDENPSLNDRILQLSFSHIEQDLKRDLKKWENYIDKQKANGKKGGRPKTQKTQAFNEKPKKADNVNVNVNVNDNVLLEKETKELFLMWIDYRKEIKKPIKSEKTLKSLAQKIQNEGYKKSKQVIEASIQNGWQGLFWDRVNDKIEIGNLDESRFKNIGFDY